MSLQRDGERGGDDGRQETAETIPGARRDPHGAVGGEGRGRLIFYGNANYGRPGFTVELESLDDLFG